MGKKKRKSTGIPRCGAKNRSGGTCGNEAGKGTDHLGEGRCKFHGGASPSKHGFYSKTSVLRLGHLIEQASRTEEPTDLLEELALQRAILMDFTERYVDLVNAMISWNEAGAETGERPQAIPPIHVAATIAEKIVKTTDSIWKRQQEGAVSVEAIRKVFDQMGIAVAKHVKDPKALSAIDREWREIRIR